MALCKRYQGENEIPALSILGTSEIFYFAPLNTNLELRRKQQINQQTDINSIILFIRLQGVLEK